MSRFAGKRTISERLSAPVFYSNSIDLVLASLPLEAGRSFDIATWTPDGLDGVISARVIGAETVPTVDGGRCTAWRVETEDENGARSVFWIEEGTRSLVAFSSTGMQIRVLHHSACGDSPGRSAAYREQVLLRRFAGKSGNGAMRADAGLARSPAGHD